MSRGYPSGTALLALLAVAGYQNRDKIAEWIGSGQRNPGATTLPPQSGASAAPPGNGGTTIGGLLSDGLRDLVNAFKQKGEGDTGVSWSTPSTGRGTMPRTGNIELRIMPSGDGGWYWEVINLKEVIARGVADTEPDACKQAGDAARKAKLIEQEKPPGDAEEITLPEKGAPQIARLSDRPL
jgi:hypothetical protein